MCEIEKDLSKLFQTTDELEIPEKSKIIGKLPNWCRGTILRVGPGDFLDTFNDKFALGHFLDGYAILSKFSISDDFVEFDKKFLQSDSYKRAKANKRPCCIEFGTKAFPEKGKGIFARFVSAITHELSDNNSGNIWQFENETFVSNDACYFRRIDQKTLQSGERYDSNLIFGFNGWTAHPLTDEESGDTYNVGFSVLAGLKFYVIKIPPKTMGQSIKETFKNAKIICTIPSSFSGGISFAHSFAMTKQWIIFIEQPYVASISQIAKAHIKGLSAKEWMEWRPNQRNRFHIVNKLTGKEIKTEYSSNPFFFLHCANAFEAEDNKIVVDVIALDDPGILDGMYLCKLRKNVVESVSQPTCRRFVIPLTFPQDLPEACNALDDADNSIDTKTICNSSAQAVRLGENQLSLIPQILTAPGCEMPCINRNYFGKPYTYFYVSGTIAKNSFSHTITKINVQTGQLSSWKGSNEYLYPSESIMVPSTSGDEDDGIILSCVYDVKPNHKDFLLFLDSKSMEEIARVEFKSHIPQALHGIFIPSKSSNT